MCTYHKIKMTIRKHFFFLATILLFISTSNTPVQAQEGKDLFNVCAACHTIGGGRLIGPDLAGITEKRDEVWLIKFIQNSQEMIQSGDADAVAIYEEYNRIPMPPNNLSDDEVRSLLSYIKNFDATAETKTETTTTAPTDETYSETKSSYTEPSYIRKANSRNFGTTFFVALILFILSLADLIVTRIIKAKFVHIIVILVTVFVMGEIVVIEAQALGRQQYYEPEQPIAFSHKVHAGQNKIDCMYCHTTANDSKHAGIPSTQLCMNCHTVVKSGTTTGTTEIDKIYASVESGKPIEWIKVHNVPDHVYFNHAQHVNIGKLDCNECHGPVETMDRIMQVSDLSMGWCIECHRTKEVQFTNNFYKDYAKLHAEINAGKRSKITVDQIGGDDCQKCHY